MKITVPRMGNTVLAAKALFDDLDIDYILPGGHSPAVLQAGSYHSPDEMCLPFKIMMGNYLECIQKGADTILIPGSCGPCRFGEYCELQMSILKGLGHNLEFIVVDSPGAIGKDEFLRRLKRVTATSPRSGNEKLKALYRTYRFLTHLEKLEAEARLLAGYVEEPRELPALLARCRNALMNQKGTGNMEETLKEYEKKLRSLPADKSRQPLKIAVIGEIYTIIEPFSNLYLEDKLMAAGVSSKRRLTPVWWVNDMVLKPLKINSPAIRLACRPYLPHTVGGHGQECIGEAVLASKEGYDGAIQVFPLGCMPEIVSKAILPNIQKDRDFPVMTLVVDEMTGEAGYITRLEAYLDMLEARRKIRSKKGEPHLVRT